MKKLLLSLFVLATFAIGADVKPFTFTGVDADSQQVEWDNLMKYKMFGQTGILFMGQNIVIPDKSGWFGTATGDFNMNNANVKHLVGGPILIGGDMYMSNQYDTLSTGPVRVTGNVYANQEGFKDGGSIINGIQCVAGTADWKYLKYTDVDSRYIGENYSNCPPEVPEIRTELTIPLAEQVADSNKLPAQVVGNSGTVYIDIPPTDGKEMYDLYIPYLQFNNGGHLYFRMQNGGRLTRVFLEDGIHNFIAGNSIQVIYMDSTAEFIDGHWTGEGAVINNTDYSGNLLFYTTRNITWPAMNPGDTIQGTFITTGEIYVKQHMVLAGQLLANYIKVDADFDGRGFLYVPFDPPVLNIDPTALASGKFQENNKNVIVPIHLDTLAKTDVYFKYCFILDDVVTQEDFNVAVPACGSDTGTVFIPAGDSLPQTNIYLNVKIDGISEGDETLKFHIFDLQGAVMPGNVHSGNFKLTLADAGEFGLDTSWHYTEFENYEGEVDYIRVLGKSDSTRFYIDSAFADRYSLDSITGLLTILDSIDYETTQIDTIKVRLTDTNGVVVIDYVPIKVTDINETPNVNDSTLTVPENLATGTTVGTIVATDPDILNPEFSTLSYKIIESVPFKIDNTGKITVKDGSQMNYETNPSFTFRVVVGDGQLFDTAQVVVNLTNVKEKPHIIDDGKTNYNVNENEVTNYVIATIKITDEDAGQLASLNWAIKNTTGADSLFKYTYKVVNDTGNIIISVKDQSKLDYEKIVSKQNFNIVVTDADGLKDSITKTITVLDVNEAPVLNDTTITLSENIPVPSIVGTLKANDEDTTSAFRQNEFVIISGNSNFGIDKTTGRITATKIFNYETDDTVFTLKVRVYDKNDPTLSDTATVTIKISDTNEGPKFATNDTTFFVDENKPAGTIGNIAAIDEDGDPITYKVIGSVPFTVDASGNVKSTRTFDYETETGFTFKVVASDGTITDTMKVNVKVNNVNEECTVNDTTFAINENSTGKVGNVNAKDKDKDNLFGTITYSISDSINYQIDKDGNVFVKTPLNYEDNTSVTVKVYITDGKFKDTATVKINVNNVPEDIVINGKVTPVNENVEIGTPVGYINGLDGDSTDVTYTINTTDFKIDPITGVITTNSNLDFETKDEYPVKVTVTSTDGSTKDTSFTIHVLNVNEPVHVKDTTLAVDEHTTGPIGKVTAYDEDNEEVSYSIDDTTNYSIDDNGTIIVIKPFDYKEKTEDTITVYVTTPNGDKDTAQIIVKINDVNDPPTLHPNDSLSVPENCDTCVVGKITATDPDNDPIVYKVVEEGFEIDTNGILTITKPLDYETTDEVTITIIATDKPKTGTPVSDTLTYKVKITDVNEPVHVNDTTFTVPENDTTSWVLIGSDEDGDSLKCYSGVSDHYIVDSNCTISLITPFDFESTPEDSITVYVTDNRGSLDSAKIKIKVSDVNEKVTITEVDDKPKQDTIKTNNPDHNAEYKICEGSDCELGKIDITVKHDTTVKVCNTKGTVCDSVVFLFNDVPPVVTLVNAKNTTADIDYITIEEQKDDKVYVNKKENEIKVVVEDTLRHTKQEFPITVELDTVKNVSKAITEYKFILDETKATVTPIGNGLAEMKEIIVDSKTGDSVEIVVLVDAQTMERKDSVQTITYTKKVDGKLVTVTYQADDMTGERVTDYQVAYNIDSATTVTYSLNDKKEIVKNEEGNIGYSIQYEYTDEYGNKSKAKIDIVFDNIPPVVEILSPIEKEIFKTNAVEVKWTVNGEVQDTLTLQRLEKGVNAITRRYVDKAGNEAIATVVVIMKEAKDIDVQIIHPVTEISQEKVDEYYSEGKKYNPEKPYEVKIVDPKTEEVPDAIGVGFLVDIALPSVSSTGGLATLDDIVKNGQIPVDDNGNIVGASTKGIPVDKYVNEHCTAEFVEEYNQKGLNIPLYDIKYQLHLWIWTTTAGYVNDFFIEYTLNDQAVASEAGTVQMVIDWLADKNGSVNASNGHQLGTSSYITRLYSKSIAKHRCDYKEQRKGERTVKKEETTKVFGYKRPIKK